MAVIIRRAEQSDTPVLLKFVHEHWRANHVFFRRPTLFAWQHQEGSHLNAVVAFDGEDLVGLLGYITMHHYDADLVASSEYPSRPVLATAIWKVIPDRTPPGLGVQLLKHMQRAIDPELMFAIGLSEMVVPLYRALKYTVGVMDHHVLINPDATKRRIAPGLAELPAPAPASGGAVIDRWSTGVRPASFEELDKYEDLTRRNYPRKSAEYLRARYLRHPEYQYDIVALAAGERTTLLVIRRVTAEESAALRIVDVVGPSGALGLSGHALLELAREQDCEYIDVQHHGLDTADLALAGFVDRRAHPDLVVPGYFEPFLQRNVDLDFSYRHQLSQDIPEFRLFRGDTDQDRPNL